MSINKPIAVEHRGPIAFIALNRPDKHNAINEELIAELTHAATSLNSCKKTRVVILKGAGKNFCAGADLTWMHKMADFSFEENKQDALILMRMLVALASLNKPTIAQIQGKVFGGGLGLIACCDFAICETGSLFCFSEAKLGLTPSTISPFIMRTIGYANTIRYFLSAELFDAEKARAMNLVSDVVAPEQLDTAVNALAATLAQNGPVAMAEIKRLTQSLQPIPETLYDSVAESLAKVRAGDEAKEGIKAFFEKRKAEW